MLPNNSISVTPEVATYLEPDLEDTSTIISLESGGIALNDASQGRLVQSWQAYINGSEIDVSPISGSPVTVLVTGDGISMVSLAFDSSMAPTICYIKDGVMKLRWFNSVISAYQTDTYPTITSARLSTDDKRRTQEGVSDVIFAYTRAGNLYWRQERDRYTIEYLVGPSGTKVLKRVGMTENLRLLFELVEP